ncbi:hypothetical protein BKA61DRAFT_590899 [Leptodontidium sp. MPI-SDFR-AT-0119]|nr:hypothetical protein BKA61DRAFT_590899 [Leptodontidium sp. MPI-SDFR-AT-0119]
MALRNTAIPPYFRPSFLILLTVTRILLPMLCSKIRLLVLLQILYSTPLLANSRSIASFIFPQLSSFTSPSGRTFQQPGLDLKKHFIDKISVEKAIKVQELFSYTINIAWQKL